MPGRVSHSYAFMASEKPLIGKTIPDMFDEIAEKPSYRFTRGYVTPTASCNRRSTARLRGSWLWA
jgi:hypothetical protein